MSWSEDPFVASSDDVDSDDPFAEPTFPAPESAADSEPSDPLAEGLGGASRRDPFVRSPFERDPGRDRAEGLLGDEAGRGSAKDPLGGDSSRGVAQDPFGGDSSRHDISTPEPFGAATAGDRSVVHGAGRGGAVAELLRGRRRTGEALPLGHGRPANVLVVAGLALSRRNRAFLVGAVLLLAALAAGTFVSSLSDDGGPRVAQTQQEADAADGSGAGAVPPATAAESQTPAGEGSDPSGPASTPPADAAGSGTVTAGSDGGGVGTSGGDGTAHESPRGCDDQSGVDPHGLISFGSGLDRLSFCGEETWQVFVCTARESDRADRVNYIEEVLGEAADWFEWASGQQYDIDFSAGDGTSVASGRSAGYEECFEQVLATPWSETRSGAVVLLDEAAIDPFENYVGVGTCGYIDEADSGVFGDSRRMVAIAVHARGEQAATAVHELGHAQCWPHSYSGKTDSEYDNPLDVVSADAWPVGTLAVNRYASGWIDPEQVRVHRGSAAQYDLRACCGGGVQMLAVLPADASGDDAGLHRRWWHLEVRDPGDSWERGLTEAGVGEGVGVSVHWIENSSGVDYERRQAQVGDETGQRSLGPVVFGSLIEAGGEFCLHSDIPTSFADCAADHEWLIEAAASLSGGLILTVSPGS